MGDIHSGPTPRGRGESDAALPVLASSGRSNAIDERVCLPILAVLRAIEARQLLEHVAASPSKEGWPVRHARFTISTPT